MTKSGNLWAVGYDNIGRADQGRDEIINLGWNKHYLELDDVAVVVRHPDGSFTFDRKAFPAANLITRWCSANHIMSEKSDDEASSHDDQAH
jgi:hypothetical protein